MENGPVEIFVPLLMGISLTDESHIDLMEREVVYSIQIQVME